MPIKICISLNCILFTVLSYFRLRIYLARFGSSESRSRQIRDKVSFSFHLEMQTFVTAVGALEKKIGIAVKFYTLYVFNKAHYWHIEVIQN